MKAAQLCPDCWSAGRRTGKCPRGSDGCYEFQAEDTIEARDAEHRAELAALAADNDAMSKRFMAKCADFDVQRAEIERLKGELAEARGVHAKRGGPHACCHECLTAPPPAESTPVQAVCQRPGCSHGVSAHPMSGSIAWGCTVHGCSCTSYLMPPVQQPAPPDDIRERLERFREAMEGRMRWHDQQFGALDKRLSALEAKGEPGTHAFVELTAPPGPPRECRVCGNPDGPPHHPKGAKP